MWTRTLALSVIAVTALTFGLLAGCSRTQSITSQPTCGDVLALAVHHDRVGDNSTIDHELEWLSDECPTAYDIATDYFSSKAMAKQLGPETCDSWSSRIRDESIQLLREDGLCTDATLAPPSWAGGSAASSQPGGGIPWSEAIRHAGTVQRVCGPLVDSGNSDDDVFLDLGRVYPDPERFQIVVWDIGGLDPIAYGSTLCTSGLITLYNGVPQIELRDPTLIEIYS